MNVFIMNCSVFNMVYSAFMNYQTEIWQIAFLLFVLGRYLAEKNKFKALK